MQKNNGGGYKSNGKDNGKDPDDDNDNVVRIPTLAERDKLRKAQEKQWRKEYKQDKRANTEPLINLPPVTKYMMLALIVPFAITSLFIDDIQRYEIFMTFGFVPGYYTGQAPFIWQAAASLFTYNLLHGGIVHLLMNVVMLAAFGTGVERWIGGKRMFVFFVLCSLGALVVHTLLNYSSMSPVIGASGGLSGLFAAVLLMMQQRGMGAAGKYGIWPFVILWIGISILFGMTGTPGTGDDTIAWAAHVGGFLAGFIFLKPVMRMK